MHAKPLALGGALRQKRKAIGLTMQSVADAAGLSVGFISQVERGISSPSLSSLASLADALQTPISAFLDQPVSQGEITRQASRESYSVAGATASYQRLSTTFEGSRLHSVFMFEPPGHRVEPISHRGEEMLFVVAGECTVEIEGVAEILKQGDSIHFDSQRVHSIWNHTDGETSLIWCGTMDLFGSTPGPIHRDAIDNVQFSTGEIET